MRDALGEGIARFNAGRYFEAHESFEDLWRASTGDDRLLWQGIVQICAGLVKLQRGQRGPAAALMGKGLAKLASATSACRGRSGVNVERLEAAMERSLDALREGLPFDPPAMEPGAVI